MSSLKAVPTLPVSTATSARSPCRSGRSLEAATALAAVSPWWVRRLRYCDSRALPAHLQPAHLGIGEEALLGELAPEQGELGEAAAVPPPRPDDGTHPVAVTGQHGHDHLSEGQQRRLRQHPHEMDPGVALEHRPQLVAPLEHLHGDGMAPRALRSDGQRLQATRHGFAVAHPRLGRDDHA